MVFKCLLQGGLPFRVQVPHRDGWMMRLTANWWHGFGIWNCPHIKFGDWIDHWIAPLLCPTATISLVNDLVEDGKNNKLISVPLENWRHLFAYFCCFVVVNSNVAVLLNFWNRKNFNNLMTSMQNKKTDDGLKVMKRHVKNSYHHHHVEKKKLQ